MISVLKSASDDNEATGECPETVAWLLAKGPRGMVHYKSPTNVPTKAACGRNLKDPEIGFGVSQAHSTLRRWCGDCLPKLPAEVFDVVCVQSLISK